MRALALDSTSGGGLHRRSAYGNFIYAWNWPAAEENFRRAIAADPNYPPATTGTRDFLAGRGRLDESLAEMEPGASSSIRCRCRSAASWAGYPTSCTGTTRRRRASARSLELDPNYAQAHFRLGLVLIQQRRYPEAIAEFQRPLDLGMFFRRAAQGLAFAYAASGRPAGGAEDRGRPQAAALGRRSWSRRSRSRSPMPGWGTRPWPRMAQPGHRRARRLHARELLRSLDGSAAEGPEVRARGGADGSAQRRTTP